MALNLWKLTKPTSYNPLPTGYIGASNVTSIGDYVVTFYAYSPSNAWLRFSDGVTTIRFTLTPTRTKYTQSYSSKTTPNFWFNDENSKGDIIIDSIELVQKPLPKLTINGISGDVADWEQGTIGYLNENVSGTTRIRMVKNVTLETGKQYTYNCASGYEIAGYIGKDNANTPFSNPLTFTAQGTIGRFVVRKIGGTGDIVPSEINNIKPVLNLGSTPAPYSKKTGDKMMLPVPKKNLFNKDTITSGFYIRTTNGTLVADSTASVSDFTLIKPSTFYVFSGVFNASNTPYAWFDVNKNYISGGANVISAITSPSNAYYIRFSLNNTALATQQLEEGTTATGYTPYAVQANKKPQHAITKAKTGLSFNGITDYLQLPSMTMDSIEIECLIDSVQPWGVNTFIDTRSGGSSYIRTDGTASSIINGTLSPSGVISNGVRQKVKVNMNAPFTDDVTIFSNYLKGTFTKGILYKVTCYLNGAIVAQYDFEKPSNLVGNQIIPNAKNLFPSLESPGWVTSGTSQFTMLGKDVLHNEGNGFQDYLLNVVPNTNYLLTCSFGLQNQNHRIRFLDYATKTIIDSISNLTPSKVISVANRSQVYLRIETNGSPGSFDFIRPQLYQLTGQEATINGAPQPQNKQAKRQLYSKR